MKVKEYGGGEIDQESFAATGKHAYLSGAGNIFGTPRIPHAHSEKEA
jgi:hypothetical protein